MNSRIPLAIIFIMLCLSNFSGKVVAQDLSIGISASFDYNAYWFVNNEQFKEYFIYNGRPGYSFGIIINRRMNDKISLRSGLYYSSKNYSKQYPNYRSINPNDPQLVPGGTPKIKYSSKFIELPIDISYRINSGEGAQTSVMFGLINSMRIGYSSKKNYPFMREEIKYNNYLLAAKGGIGVLIKVKESSILFEPQLRYYITQVHEAGNPKNPFYMGIEVSYLLPMKKKE